MRFCTKRSHAAFFFRFCDLFSSCSWNIETYTNRTSKAYVANLRGDPDVNLRVQNSSILHTPQKTTNHGWQFVFFSLSPFELRVYYYRNGSLQRFTVWSNKSIDSYFTFYASQEGASTATRVIGFPAFCFILSRNPDNAKCTIINTCPSQERGLNIESSPSTSQAKASIFREIEGWSCWKWWWNEI